MATLSELLEQSSKTSQPSSKTGVKELTVKEIVQISSWLSGNAKIMERSTAAARIAALAKATGVNVSDSQLRRVEKELGYEFQVARDKPSRKNSFSSIDTLVVAMLDLYERLGEKPPEFLRLLASHRSRDEIDAAVLAFRAARP